MDVNEFERDKAIDPNQLDLEAINMPNLYHKWARLAVDAKTEVDRCKLEMDLIEVQLSMRCREKPSAFGIPKVTESAIHGAVRSHEDYCTAAAKWVSALETSKLLDRAVSTMEIKKRMIEILVTLHGQQYFAGPSVPRDLAAAWLAQKQEAENQIVRQQAKRARRRIRKRGDSK